jgi:DNA repair photolyase
MGVTEVECKSALSSSTLPGLTYSLNPYRGCQHNCAYCYAPNVLRMERGHWGDGITVKNNIPVILAKELKNKKPGVVGLSTVTDPYQPLEKKYELSRLCLEQILRVDFPVCIQTKSSLVRRDLDILSKFSDVELIMSIGTLHDEERKIVEPGSSSIEQRLSVLREFSERGIRTVIFFGPIYPTINNQEIPNILDTFLEYGISEMIIDSLNLKPGIKECVNERLSNNPALYNAFSKYFTEKVPYDTSMRNTIILEGKKRNMKIVDAF